MRQQCDLCGEWKFDVARVADPYLRDVDNEDVEVDLCTKCYERKSDDI